MLCLLFSHVSTTQNNTKKYLAYSPHSGFANQLIAIVQGAHLARYMMRTLVLPPILTSQIPYASVALDDQVILSKKYKILIIKDSFIRNVVRGMRA